MKLHNKCSRLYYEHYEKIVRYCMKARVKHIAKNFRGDLVTLVVSTTFLAAVQRDGIPYYFNAETGETSWGKPEELMSAEELNSSGSWYWVPDEKECFLAGRVTEERGKRVLVCFEDSSTSWRPRAELQPLQRSSLARVPEDLVLLDCMSPPHILHALKHRFNKDLIYTAVGNILIAVNPYTWIDKLYSEHMMKVYAKKEVDDDVAPHIYNIAHDAFYGLSNFGQDQSIVISGESGAGKTEATKQCLRYLAHVAGSVSHVERKVLQANPILEAFGNAKTIRNDNSSRFGKFVKVFFNQQNKIAGSLTTNYLLEKIRVVHQQANERNFHIFYQITKADAKTRASFHLQNPEHYRYAQTCCTVACLDDERDWEELHKAFRELGIPPQENKAILSVVAAVLCLGNVDFRDPPSGRGEVQLSNTQQVAFAADLLGLTTQQLERALKVRQLRIKGHQSTQVTMTAKEARDSADALAKFLYGANFDWLVQRINQSMGDAVTRMSGQRYIGILDIFGFEIFEHNSFEQLCINFTNEMLQQHFNRHTFKLEEQIYEAEKIKYRHVEFIDNQPMLDLITKKPTGVLPLLDEELVMPGGSDRTFLNKLQQHQKSNQVYESVRQQPDWFVIRHYAGKVSYDGRGFLEKNRDTLTEDLMELLSTSRKEHMQVLFPPDAALSAKERKYSLSKQFQKQLNDLMYALNKTEPHYVRCIKPNDGKKAREFVTRRCYDQLLYSGVFEAVAIRKQGFPFRMKHEAFADRYRCIFADQDGILPEGKGLDQLPAKEMCEYVIQHMKLDRANVQVGISRILYRAQEYKTLELVAGIKIRTQSINKALASLCAVEVGVLDGKEAQEAHFEELARWVVEADELRLKSKAAERARDQLERYVEERMDPAVKKEMAEAFRSKDRARLEKVLQVCAEEGYRTKQTFKCQQLLEAILDCQDALELAITEQNVEYLEKALDMARDISLEDAVVVAARTLLQNVTRAKAMIKRAIETLDHQKLKATVEFCDSFNYDTPDVRQVKFLCEQIAKARANLKEALKKVDKKTLEQAIQGADIVGYKGSMMSDARRLLTRLTRIEIECTKARETLDARSCMVVVRAAEEVNMKSKDLAYLSMLLAGPREEFLDAQFKKAVRRNDIEQAVRCFIKRRDRECANPDFRTKYQLERFPRLKEPLDWGREKWFGSAQTRALNMLSHQTQYIHSPLLLPARSRLEDSVYTKVVLNCYETVQMVVAMRGSVGSLLAKTHELLLDGFRYAEIRDDIFVCTMKQIRGNSEPAQVAMGFELIALCLCVFPPSQDLQPFLDVFLRSNNRAQKTEAENTSTARKCVSIDLDERYQVSKRLAQRMLQGVRKAAPISQDVISFQQLVRQPCASFEEPQSSTSSWLDIQRSFYAKGKEVDYEEAPKAKKSSKAKKEASSKEKKEGSSKKKRNDRDKENKNTNKGSNLSLDPSCKMDGCSQATFRRGYCEDHCREQKQEPLRDTVASEGDAVTLHLPGADELAKEKAHKQKETLHLPGTDELAKDKAHKKKEKKSKKKKSKRSIPPEALPFARVPPASSPQEAVKFPSPPRSTLVAWLATSPAVPCFAVHVA
eukprot:g73135.t1